MNTKFIQQFFQKFALEYYFQKLIFQKILKIN